MLDNEDNTRMTVFERIKPIELHDDKATQIMYNRLRHKGILWFEANGNNMGITTNLRDENDDGLRIIDAEYMEAKYRQACLNNTLNVKYGIKKVA